MRRRKRRGGERASRKETRIYSGRLSAWWWERVREETVARVALSQIAGFDGKGRHLALGPSAWQVGNRR